MKLSTRLKRDISPELLAGKTIKAIVDCTAAHKSATLDDADICHRALLSVGCKPLWQESPVINEKEIIIHYTTTNYRRWCKAEGDTTMNETEIINALNECAAEIEDAGDWIIDCVIDSREDEGLPPFTPEELAAAKVECDKNADIITTIEKKMEELRTEYFFLTGKYPHYNPAINRYSIAW